MVAGEHHGRPRHDDQWPPDETEPCGPSRHEFGAVHQVAEDQPVPPPDDPAGAEEEGPVLDRREGVRHRALAAIKDWTFLLCPGWVVGGRSEEHTPELQS